ncbi:MAG TPA: winged helix-turn-helix domain-containing protein [Hyphomicrobiaceae bacterium]|nr:winged helix-turn-helix domain-containing protein [Hyphomicrobiaceae bacterium]
MLLALVERRGQVVSKDTLMAEGWPDRVVEENNLQGQISALRKVLAADSDGERYLQTVPGRGYRFVAPVEHERSAAGTIFEVSARRDALAWCAPLHSKPAIAVIPFINLSSDPQQEYFSDGITDDIVTELSRSSELHVIASNSSFKLKGRDVDVRQVGSRLGVSYLLEGSVRKVGQHVRITAKLVDAINGAHCWAERYDRELMDVFAVQDEVARTIVSILTAHVGKLEAARVLARPPQTWQAYDYYLQGRESFASFLTTYRAADLYEARRHLQSALAIDPNYARAHAVLSNIHLCGYIHRLDDDYLTDAALERAHEIARKAVQLDPNLTVAREHLGLVLSHMGRHAEALAEFEKVTALNPNFSNWRYGLALVYGGEAEKAIKVLRAITHLDPFYPAAAAGFFGVAYYTLKRYAEAQPWLLECTSRAPNFRAGHSWRAANHAQLGQLDEARRDVSEVLRLDPTFTIDHTVRRLAQFRRPEDADHFFDGLRKAGLPVQ